MKKKPPIISSLAIIIALLTCILVISGWFTNNDFIKSVAPIAFFVFLSAFFVLLISFLFSIRNNVRQSKHAEVNIKATLQEISDYKYALDESSIVAITDQKGIIKYTNDNFCKISKYSAEELIGKDHRIINSGYHAKEFIRNLWVTIAKGGIWKGELKNRAKDGTIYWVDTTIVPFLDNGKPYQYVAIKTDITERKKLEEQQALFSSIVNFSDDAILTKSLDGIITSWNHGAEKVFGYSAAEIIGKHISLLIPTYLCDEENKIIKKIIRGEVVDHYETERVKKDATVIKVSLTISGVKDSAGNITGASKIVRDITQQKKAEEEVNKAYREKETVLNRINDSVISVDNEWRYTFLNDAALTTHPLGKQETLGKVIWDVHPEMKGGIFWKKYHEAMLNKKVVEIESYYAPMDAWFNVKIYPSPDGLTIFYKDFTERRKAEEKLSQTLKEVMDYKFALDQASIVAITDQKGIIKYANDNFCKISKYTEEELIGKDHRIINSGYHPKEFIRDLWVTIANGNIWKGELKNKAKDGTIYWVDTTIVPFLNEQGKPYQYVAIRADITERKHAEENIKATLKEIVDYRYALDESSIVAITDQKGIIKYANNNFCKISKYSAEELIGQDHQIINSGYHPKEFIRNLWVTIANGKIWKGELKNKARDGTIYWVDTTIVPFLNDEAKPYQYVAIRADITERKLVEENLRESLRETAEYKYALDESSIVAITDQKGIIKYANNNFCKISKYSVKELIGRDHRIINSDYHPKEFIRDLWVTIANGKIWKGELKNKAKDGTIYWVDTTIVPFLDHKGKPYQYVAIRSDITERKQGEENIKVTLKEISDYKYALDESSIVAITDQKGIIKYANNNFCKISKYSEEELIGQDHRIINSGYHPKEFIRNLWVTIANGKIWKGELKNKAKDQTIYWVDTTIIPFLNEEGKPYQYVAIRADITERKLVEENLQKSLQETADYKYALDESSIVAITDQKGIIKYANDNFCKISKYSVEELIGKDHRIINSGYHPKEFIGDLWVTIANGKIWKGELKNKAKDGTIYWVDTTIVPFLNAQGKPYQYVAIRADITERKHVEENIKVTLREISDYKYALNESSIVAITDQRGIIKYANHNFCKISKYTEEELIGQDHRIINSGYHPKKFIRNLWVTIANGEIWKGELKNKAKDGTIYWVDTTIIPFLNEEGKPYQYVAIRADITERKLVEENLQKSLKETADYKYALDESSIVAITDQKGIIKYANNNFCEISKYSKEELIGKDHRIINSGYHPKEFIRDLWVTIANGKIWKGELKNKAKDGTIYWVDTTIVPFLDYEGKPYQYVAIRADITERKQAEDELIKSEKIYKTIASSIPGSVICLIDAEYRYALIEGDMFEKLGYSKNRLLGNKAGDVLPTEIFTGVPNEFKRVFGGETITNESSSHGYDIISRFIPLKDENDVVYSIMTVAMDVTELKNAQRDIIDLNRDLEEKIAKRTEQLKKSNDELEAFSYSVSHDLRAPLRGIIGFTTILEEDYVTKLDDEAKRITTIIKKNASKMGHLIDDLLAFSRLGREDITKSIINTGAMVEEVILELQAGARIEWVVGFLPAIKGGMDTIRQVWLNFISNAIKYSGQTQNPRIQIGSFAQDGQTVFFVKDNGVGFDVQYSNKLFKVFQRLHSAEEFEGTGVGLALAGRIISKHGGKVWAEGEVNKGATFYFSLPELHIQPKHKSIMI